jgi:DNA polymerase-3 subunit gamma/tau
VSYLALARKWRPRRFDDVLGQKHVVQALVHALDGDRLHPAILLTGTRGVGKTTLGRIIAKSLNCETGVSANPCGQCSACREVDEGRFVDLLEIDAASRTKVDDTRQLLDNVQYSPVRGRYKVYLIDEVHMLSNSSFNALLKTLEEPPPHVKFILATTDPQKLPVTVLSRCLQFALKRLPPSLIRDALTDVLAKEGVEAEPGAVAEIARAADGSMRDGLSLLDQAIAFAGGGAIRVEAVEEMLGSVGRRTLFGLLQALVAADGAAVLGCIERLDAQSPDFAALLNELAAALQRIAVLQVLPAAADEDDDEVLRQLAATAGAEDIQLFYQIAVLGRRDLPWAPDPRLGFEMTLLRMLAFRPESGGGGAAPSTGGGTRTSASRPAAAPAAAASTVTAGASVDARAAPAPAASKAAGNAVQAASAAPSAPSSAAQVREPTPSPSSSPASAGDDGWNARIEAIELDPLTRQLARHCAWLGQDNGTLRLRLEYGTRHLLTEERRTILERKLATHLGTAPLKLAVEVAADGERVDSPTQHDRERAVVRQREAEAAFDADPTVQDFRRVLGATVRPGSVQPLN